MLRYNIRNRVNYIPTRYRGCNCKVRTNVWHEFYIPKQKDIVTRYVTVDGYWIVNWIYCTLQPIITAEYLNSSTTNSVDSILYICCSAQILTRNC
jgi:hypothetical protein